MRGFLLGFGLLVLLGGCANVSGIVLARVNDEPITVRELNETFSSSHRGHGVLLAGKGAVRQFLDKVVDRRLLIQEAKRVGLDQDPALQKAVEELRAKRAAEILYEREVNGNVRIWDDEVAATYERLRYRFAARHLLVATREDAERARGRIKAGEAFGDVAKAVSLAPTATRGGELGIVTWGRLDPQIEDVLWTLDTGDLSKPFRTEDGWNLLYVVDRVLVDPPHINTVRPQIVARLTQQARSERATVVFKKLMRRWNGAIRESLVVDALQGRTGDPAAVVAEAAGQTITREQALKLVNVDAAKALPPPRLDVEVKKLLEDQLFKILLRKEGVARGYGDRPEVDRDVRKLVDSAIVDLLADRVILAKLSVTDGDVEAYYRSHEKDFTELAAVKLTAILVASDGEARTVMSDAERGKDFGTLARTLSKDPTLAASGGDLGWVTTGKLDPEVEAVAFSLGEGKLGIAKGKAGPFVIRVDKKREARLRPLAEVRDEAKQRALRERSQQMIKAWVTKLRDASSVEIDERAIDRAVASYEASVTKKAAVAGHAHTPEMP